MSEELCRLRSYSHKSTSTGPATLIRRIEGEREDAKLELRQLRVECKSLKDRLKGLQDGHHRDLTTLEDRIAELQLQLDEVRQASLPDHLTLGHIELGLVISCS